MGLDEYFGVTHEEPKDPEPEYIPSKYSTFDELEKAVASEYGRRHIGYPCDIGQSFPVGSKQRDLHCNHCPECKKLLDRLDIIAGIL
jgi:hypothetical protein